MKIHFLGKQVLTNFTFKMPILTLRGVNQKINRKCSMLFFLFFFLSFLSVSSPHNFPLTSNLPHLTHLTLPSPQLSHTHTLLSFFSPLTLPLFNSFPSVLFFLLSPFTLRLFNSLPSFPLPLTLYLFFLCHLTLPL